MPKKVGKVRMCVDFRDLNKDSLKNDFPLPHIDILIDNIAGHALLSFMDGFSGSTSINSPLTYNKPQQLSGYYTKSALLWIQPQLIELDSFKELP